MGGGQVVAVTRGHPRRHRHVARPLAASLEPPVLKQFDSSKRVTVRPTAADTKEAFDQDFVQLVPFRHAPTFRLLGH